MKVTISIRSKKTPQEIVEVYLCDADQVSSFITDNPLKCDQFIVVESIKEYHHE